MRTVIRRIIGVAALLGCLFLWISVTPNQAKPVQMDAKDGAVVQQTVETP
ncbi:hypothetical protein [Lactobacillus selangorensis]|nr:hypothetical protein [Lactobacillus selangorensis]